MAIDHEAAVAAGDGREIDGRGASSTENHIGTASINAGGSIGLLSRHDQIGEAIAVHIPGTGHAPAAVIGSTLAIDHEAAAAAGDLGEVDNRGEAESRGGASATIIAGGIGVGTGSNRERSGAFGAARGGKGSGVDLRIGANG